MLIIAGGDPGPSLAGGSSTALLEFESCLLQHLSTITVLHGSGKNFDIAAAVVVILFLYCYLFVSTFLLFCLHYLVFQCFPKENITFATF